MAAHDQRSDLDALRQQARADRRVVQLLKLIPELTLGEINTWCSNLLQWLHHRGRGHFLPVRGDELRLGYGLLFNAGLLEHLVAEVDRRARERAAVEGTVELVMALAKQVHHPPIRVGHLKPPSMQMIQLWGPTSNVWISPSFLVEYGGPGKGLVEWERWRLSGRAPEDAQAVLDEIHRKWPGAHVDWPPPHQLDAQEEVPLVPPQPVGSSRTGGRRKLEDDPRTVREVKTVDDSCAAERGLTKRAACLRVGISEDTYYETVKRLRDAGRYPVSPNDRVLGTLDGHS